MITLTELKSNFQSVLKFEGSLLLYQERGTNSPSRSNHEYLCGINKHKNGYIINDDISTYANNIDKLKENINAYITSLPYHHAYYDKSLRSHLFIEMIINDYMKTLGFTTCTGYNASDAIFEKKMKKFGKEFIFAVILNDMETENEFIDVSIIESGSKWIEVKAKRDVESIKKTVNTLISMYSFQSIAEDISLLRNIGGDIESLQLMKVDITSSKPFNQELKEKLLELAEKL